MTIYLRTSFYDVCFVQNFVLIVILLINVSYKDVIIFFWKEFCYMLLQIIMIVLWYIIISHIPLTGD